MIQAHDMSNDSGHARGNSDGSDGHAGDPQDRQLSNTGGFMVEGPGAAAGRQEKEIHRLRDGLRRVREVIWAEEVDDGVKIDRITLITAQALAGPLDPV